MRKGAAAQVKTKRLRERLLHLNCRFSFKSTCGRRRGREEGLGDRREDGTAVAAYNKRKKNIVRSRRDTERMKTGENEHTYTIDNMVHIDDEYFDRTEHDFLVIFRFQSLQQFACHPTTVVHNLSTVLNLFDWLLMVFVDCFPSLQFFQAAEEISLGDLVSFPSSKSFSGFDPIHFPNFTPSPLETLLLV